MRCWESASGKGGIRDFESLARQLFVTDDHSPFTPGEVVDRLVQVHSICAGLYLGALAEADTSV